MIHLVTFSDESMSRARALCVASGERHGMKACFVWDNNYLAGLPFFRENAHLLTQPRGLGYWAWKPFIISEEMKVSEDGNYICYSDAGVEFIDNIRYIVDRMDQDVWLFGNNWEHAHWCKRDVIDAVWPPDSLPPRDGWGSFGKQVQASVIFFRVSDYSRKFVAEWLKWCLHRERFSEGVCTDEWRYLIDDSPSRLPNHPEFREHRHDQAILTTLAYREGIRLHYWPAQYNDGAFSYEKLPEYAEDDYPILFHHHRRRNHEWSNAA